VIRRLALLAVVACALVAGGAVLIGARGAGSDPYRVDAIFNNADFLVAGQDVKIAGAVEGRVKAVRLTPDHRARIEMEVNREFAPFHSDASCSIRPQSLIGEKFVDCDPGTIHGGPLRPAPGGGAPAVAVQRNHSPVDLDLVFDSLRLPYRQRLTILVNELGVGLAGRPAELNRAIRSANPALERANRVLAIIDSQRATLGHLIDASDEVLAQLASRRGDVRDFIGRADRVAQAVASRRGALSLALHRLPPMLDQLEPAATDLAGLASDARPVANDLRTAARPFGQLLGDLGPLTDAARPTLVKLNELSQTGMRAVRSTEPVAAKLLPIARRLPELSRLTAVLQDSLQKRGVVEGLLSFTYLGTASQSRFDRFSHILPSYQIAGTCQVYATTPTPGCDAHWKGGAGSREQRAARAGLNQKRSAPRSSAPRNSQKLLDYLLKP
jgi:virulence factor Mce-like protein